jgi:hypothetical protein
MYKIINLCLLMLSFQAIANHHHLPLEMSTAEYQQLLRQHWFKLGDGATKANSPEIQTAIDGGEVLFKWLKRLNAIRPADDQIRLSSGTVRGGGIPIDKPSKYGPKTIIEKLNKIQTEMPKAMLTIIYGGMTMTDLIPASIAKEDFIKHGRSANYLYQTAVRWTTAIEPWLDYYKRNKKRDVRGLFHLKKMSDLDGTLNDYFVLSNELKAELKNHLTGLCMNAGLSLSKCERAFNKAAQTAKVREFKNKYWSRGQATWDTFYNISKARTDVSWSKKTPHLMSAPFRNPNNPRIANWLKENIEAEFKTDTWNFELNFEQGAPGMAYLEFKPNVTPHVSGGNVVVMDANSPIEEFSVKWTIRHEYGHILRMPDCYVEFYDEKEEVAVNYQLDVTDLMCSRAGDMNDRIYNELKRVYYK